MTTTRTLAHDALGNIIAWIDSECTGPNPACRRAHRAGRIVHIIPAHTDPRAENCHIALNTYHYATRDDALAALEIAWKSSILVDNPRDRDEQYRLRHDVRIVKNTGNF